MTGPASIDARSLRCEEPTCRADVHSHFAEITPRPAAGTEIGVRAVFNADGSVIVQFWADHRVIAEVTGLQVAR